MKVPICRLSRIAAESEAIEREDSAMSDAGIGMETAATAATNRAGNEARERTREEKCMGNPVSYGPQSPVGEQETRRTLFHAPVESFEDYG